MSANFEALLKLCQALPNGSVPSNEPLVQLLQACWHEFEGDPDSLAAHKLNRIEDPTLEWPYLRFNIERHGAIVAGDSSRAQIHRWDVNLEQRTAVWAPAGHRQVRPQQKRLDTAALAQEIVNVVKARAPDPRVSWRKNGTIRIEIGLIISGEGPKQTTTSRRKKFNQELELLLTYAGYRKIKANCFQPQE